MNKFKAYDLSKLKAEFAPTGKLRASINLGNPILASVTDSGHVQGVSVDLANRLATSLSVELELVVLDSAGKSVEAVNNEDADFGFFAIDPKRGEKINFTAPYVLITGSYLVPEDSPLTQIEQVDEQGTTVVVGKGSAYDLFLSRQLHNARIERAPTSPKVVEHFLQGGFDVAAGVTQQLLADHLRLPGLRMLPGNFMTIRQAMGLPKTRDADAWNYLKHFVEEAKQSGFVTDALARHQIEGAEVAPAEFA